MKKVFVGMVIGITLAVLAIMAIELTEQAKAENPKVSACDKAQDGTAYVIEGNEVVKTFQAEECEK